VLVVGLTGGIGSGKSTVSGLLARRGAVIIDADLISREVVEPGGPAYAGIVERFGRDALAEDGTLDRPKLAALVFNDESARRDLNALTHPAVNAVMAQRALEQAATDNVVVLDIPLLAEGGRDRYGLAGIIVVDTPVEVAVARLVEQRGFTEADARARIAAQVTREQRRAIADVVVDNSGGLDALVAEIDRVWTWIEALRQPSPQG